MNQLPLAKRIQIIAMLVEGNSLRSTSRVTDTAINTVMKLLVDTGHTAQRYQDTHLQNLACARLQIDEIWSFCHTKSMNLEKPEPGKGDIWTYTAIDPDTKLVAHWMVGYRTAQDAQAFIRDLSFKIAGKVQLTSDGFNGYSDPVKDYAHKWDYAQYIKLYERGGTSKSGPKDKYIGHQLKTITGAPFERDISTSICERHNLTMRMSIKRFARKTNAHSKKVENHQAAVALHMFYYNFGRIHSSLRITPAMAAGVVDRIIEIEELLQQ